MDDIRSAYTTLFIYLQAIVVLDPGNIVTIDVSMVRFVVQERKEVRHSKGNKHARVQRPSRLLL